MRAVTRPAAVPNYASTAEPSPTPTFFGASLTLNRTGSVGVSDHLGSVKVSLAGGVEDSAEKIILRSVTVGTHVVRDVEALVVSVKGDPLLGQTFLSQLHSWSIDNKRHMLLLNDGPAQPGE